MSNNKYLKYEENILVEYDDNEGLFAINGLHSSFEGNENYIKKNIKKKILKGIKEYKEKIKIRNINIEEDYKDFIKKCYNNEIYEYIEKKYEPNDFQRELLNCFLEYKLSKRNNYKKLKTDIMYLTNLYENKEDVDKYMNLLDIYLKEAEAEIYLKSQKMTFTF